MKNRERIAMTTTTRSRSQTLNARRSIVAGLSLLLACLAETGCQKPLFPEKEPRSQFETYDTLRQQNQPLVVPDEFGNPQPALRARLTPQN